MNTQTTYELFHDGKYLRWVDAAKAQKLIKIGLAKLVQGDKTGRYYANREDYLAIVPGEMARLKSVFRDGLDDNKYYRHIEPVDGSALLPFLLESPYTPPHIRQALIGTTTIDADGAVELFSMEKLMVADCCPTLPRCFVEFKRPKSHCGVYLERHDEDGDAARWTVRAVAFDMAKSRSVYGHSSQNILGPPGECTVRLDASGRLLKDRSYKPYEKMVHLYGEAAKVAPVTFTEDINVALYALSLVNRPGFVLNRTDDQPLEANRESFQPSGRITYRIVVVDPNRIRYADQKSAELPNHIEQPLHMVRGHRKRFSGKGLFGKINGDFWWNHQVRGKPTNGISLKDYKVLANGTQYIPPDAEELGVEEVGAP